MNFNYSQLFVMIKSETAKFYDVSRNSNIGCPVIGVASQDWAIIMEMLKYSNK